MRSEKPTWNLQMDCRILLQICQIIPIIEQSLPSSLHISKGNQTIMYEFGDNTIQRIDWQNVFPVVLLPRAYKYALGVRVILLAFLGLAVTIILAGFFGTVESEVISGRGIVAQADSMINMPVCFVPSTSEQFFPGYSDIKTRKTYPHWYEYMMTFSSYESHVATNGLVSHELSHPWTQLTATGYAVFTRPTFITLGWFAVVLAIWAWFGGMITRVVALRFAQDRRESWSQLINFMRKKWLSYIGAMILPIAGILLALLPVWLINGIGQAIFAKMSLSDALWWGGGVVHLVLIFPFALVAVLITIGFAFGWPLMFAAISTEGSDAFDAVSRGFSYVYQRPIQFVFYHLCNLVIYMVGIIIAWFVFHQTITLIGYDPTGLMILINSFAFAYFWSSSTVIYFLLRRSCDATPFDQVYLGNVKKRTFPPFEFGKNGEPELKTPKIE